MTMKKIVKTLAVEDGMCFDEICSFKTDNYVGIWDHTSERYVMFMPFDCEFHMWTLDECGDLEELDAEVYHTVGEHIIGASDKSTYNFSLRD